MTTQKFIWSCGLWETEFLSSYIQTVWAVHVPVVAPKESCLITDELVKNLVEPRYYPMQVKQREIALLRKTFSAQRIRIVVL